MNLNLFFNKLTNTLHLGTLLSDAAKVEGGLMHKMYKLNTSSGTYAVKLLNPKVMERPEAMNNYLEADRLESILQKEGIPLVPSLTFRDRKMQRIDEQYFYVYEWFGGKSPKSKDITKLHCQKISSILSCIHQIDMKNEKYQRTPINIDWNYYIRLAQEQNIVLFDLLIANKDLLYESQNKGNASIISIPTSIAICHNDMDSKNVLWMEDTFKIIDLECLGYANPYLELFELALCWSGYEECNIDFELFGTFMTSYFHDIPKPNIDWESMYYSNYSRLEWLEYNIKRVLCLECNSPEEQTLGMRQVKETIDHIIYYHHAKHEIVDCLHKLFVK